jgi:hypothetical protein
MAAMRSGAVNDVRRRISAEETLRAEADQLRAENAKLTAALQAASAAKANSLNAHQNLKRMADVSFFFLCPRW